MEILPQIKIKTTKELISYVNNFASTKELFKKDFALHITNKKMPNNLSPALINSVKSVKLVETFENLVMIGGSNVSILNKNGEYILPKISFLDLHEICPESLDIGGKIINIIKLFEFLASKIKSGQSVFLDFAYPIRPTINQFGLADGILIPRSSGAFMRKGHNLEHAKDIKLGEYFGGLIGGHCTVVNDTITGLLPDFDINVIVGTGFNIGYRDGANLVNLESSHFYSQYLPLINNLAGDYDGIGLLVAGGPQKILSQNDNWGIPGIYNCLSENKKVTNAKQVFELAQSQDILANTILKLVGLLIESMLDVVAKEIKNENPKIQYTGSVIKALLEVDYLKL